MILLGKMASKIEHNSSTSQWILTNDKNEATASSKATELSYALGKHPWTVSNDNCRKGKPYNTMLKLTGCVEGDFTCNDGQCIKIERRCDQVTGKVTAETSLMRMDVSYLF